MNIRLGIWCLVVAAFASVVGVEGQTRVPPPPQSRFSAIDAVLDAGVRQRLVPGAVVIVADREKVLYLGAAGTMNARARRAMKKDALFRIQSMTKPITAVAVMMLQEQGKLSVEDPVARYLPALTDVEVVATFNEYTGDFTTRKPAEELRIRHLLSNTSGFGYAFSNAMLKGIREKTRKPTEESPLLHDPGSQWTYGMSAKLLGQIVEQVSGMKLDQFFTNRIFRPLAMDDTFYMVPSGKLSRVATVNHRDSKGGFSESANPSKIGSRAAGDGGLVSTASDYAKFLQMFLNEGTVRRMTLLSPESVQAMTRNQIGDIFVETQQTTDPAQSKSFPFGAGRDKFGFAFQIAAGHESDPDMRFAGSYSWSGSDNTHFWVDPTRGVAAVLMTQVTPFYDEGAMQLLEQFERAVGRAMR